MTKIEVFGGLRTRYRGSEEDWAPTKMFVETWRDEVMCELPKCYVYVADVNYVTDSSVDGVRVAHYEFETYYGIDQYSSIGGGVVFRREKPDSWLLDECLMFFI